jgi:hypothetical protein
MNLFSEAINDRRSVMRHIGHTKKVYIHYLVSAPKKLKSAGDKRLVIQDALCIQGHEEELDP